jgi:hypothetical protein
VSAARTTFCRFIRLWRSSLLGRLGGHARGEGRVTQFARGAPVVRATLATTVGPRFDHAPALGAVLGFVLLTACDGPAGKAAPAPSETTSVVAAAPPTPLTVAPCATGSGTAVTNVPPSLVRSAIQAQQPALDACFATLRQRQPEVSGILTSGLRFECGRVASVTREGPDEAWSDPQFLACIGKAYRAVRIAAWERVGPLLIVRDRQTFE